VPDLTSYEDALAASEEVSGNRHLLLGNGFSIACRPDSFAYGKLFDEADFSGLQISADSLFAFFGTADFERVIDALRVSAAVLDLYQDGLLEEAIEQIEQDASCLKEALAEVLARKHPDNVANIEDKEYESARRFLANFDGGIYTVNYDLLLYWTLMHISEPKIASRDGFHSDPEEEDAAWVIWDGYEDYRQRIFFCTEVFTCMTWDRSFARSPGVGREFRSSIRSGMRSTKMPTRTS